jgi:hypothetical protein
MTSIGRKSTSIGCIPASIGNETLPFFVARDLHLRLLERDEVRRGTR